MGSWDDFYLAKTGDVKTDSDKTDVSDDSVKLAKVKAVKAKAAKKKATVSFKKVKNATGYQIQYATKKNFKNAETVSSKKNSKVIRGLKSKKVYYVRVRAYAKNGSEKAFGAYSSAVKVKVK